MYANVYNHPPMKHQDFDFKEILQETITKAKDSFADMKSIINILSLYAKLYEEPFITGDSRSRDMGIDYEALTDNLIPEQVAVLNRMLEEGGLLLFGCRKTGKTYLDALGVIILGTLNKLQVHILSSKKDTASYVIEMIGNICRKYKLDIIDQEAITHLSFKNGTTVKAHSNTVADTGTYEADILIIDEAQEVEKQVWSKIFPMMLTGRKMHVWITGTAKAGSRFHTFWFDDDLKTFDKFTLRKEDVTKGGKNEGGWVTEAEWKIVRAGMTERMWRQEVLMEWVEEEGAFFRSEDLDEAFKDYQLYDHKSYTEIIVPIDWGWGHEHAMYVLGILNGVIYELDSWSMQNAPRATIMRKFEEFHRKYHKPLFILEGGQTAADWVGHELEEKNYNFTYSLFGKNKKWFWDAMEFVLDSKRIKLKNATLKSQLLRYCGDKKEDDHVDSILHGVEHFVRSYLKEDYSNWYEDE